MNLKKARVITLESQGTRGLSRAMNNPAHHANQMGPQATALDTLRSLASSPDVGLTGREAARRLGRLGSNEVPERRTHPVLDFARKFWGPSAWMLELIAALSFILNKRADLIVAAALLLINAILSFLQEQRASAAVTALRKQLQVTARVLRDGQWQAISARSLVDGDVIRLRSGDFVPADTRIIDGGLRVDQSALTGESHELGKTTDDALYSGSIVRQGEVTAVVTATGTRTFFGRTTQLVESARPKLHVEQVIGRVVKWLFLIVGSLVAITVIVSLARGFALIEILPISLVLLMSAIPVALPVMFTVSMAVGSIELARQGVLVTRLNASEDAAEMDVLCADKTGTLTLNRLSLVNVLPQPGFTAEEVIRNGALASNDADQDPIDLAFLRAARERTLLHGDEKTLSFAPFSANTRRTEAIIDTGDGPLRIMKGALRTIGQLAAVSATALDSLEERMQQEAEKGYRALAVARAIGNESPRLIGVALLSDAPRSDSRSLITELRELGVSVKMLTGDALPVAREIANNLGIGKIERPLRSKAASQNDESEVEELIRKYDGLAEIFPEDKFSVVKSLQSDDHVVGMTGDGVNDAPALRQAEVGIAVMGATDVAKGAASVVLTAEGLAGIVALIKDGRAIHQRIVTWIVNKISRTILKAGFVVVSFLVTGRFVISALGMVLVVFMTDFVKISLSTDQARSSQRPETWNIQSLAGLAVVLGLCMLIEALGLLAMGWHWFGLVHHPGRLQTFTFETLLFFALFSILSIRERRAFWASRPSTTLAVALTLDACAGVLIGLHGFAELAPLPVQELIFIIGFALVFSLAINDLVKLVLIAR
jgi:H+-transporting ATPase